jgi:serine/threonine-protein kinase ULK/ATG1
MLIVGDGAPAPAKNKATSAIKKIEELAQLSYAVYGFAEVKYRVLDILTAMSIKTCQRRKCSV